MRTYSCHVCMYFSALEILCCSPDLISIPARHDTSPRISPGPSFTNVLNFKDSVCSAQAPDPPDSVAIPRFLTTEKKISSVSGEDSNKPSTFAANNIDARVTLDLSSVSVYKDGAGLERQRGYG